MKAVNDQQAQGKGDTAASMQTSLVGQLATEWRARATELRKWAAAEGAACALETAAEELDCSLRAERDEVLSLGEAAKESGYSADHLGREVRNGRIPNVGRLHSPAVRRGDLRRKRGGLLNPVKPANIPTRRQIAQACITPNYEGCSA